MCGRPQCVLGGRTDVTLYCHAVHTHNSAYYCVRPTARLDGALIPKSRIVRPVYVCPNAAACSRSCMLYERRAVWIGPSNIVTLFTSIDVSIGAVFSTCSLPRCLPVSPRRRVARLSRGVRALEQSNALVGTAIGGRGAVGPAKSRQGRPFAPVQTWCIYKHQCARSTNALGRHTRAHAFDRRRLPIAFYAECVVIHTVPSVGL